MHGWMSESIEKLAPALLAAQSAMRPATKDSSNPHFKSKYADLNEVIDVVTEAFEAHGLVVTQLPMPGPGGGLIVKTVVIHAESGQWIASDLPVCPEMNNPQKVGASVTYARRYGLAAVACLTQEDDDGETAAGRGQPGGGYSRQGPAPRDRDDRAPREKGGGSGVDFGNMPGSGKALFAWAKSMNEKLADYEIDVVKWLDKWGQREGLPKSFKEWADDEVKKGAAACAAAITRTVQDIDARDRAA